MSRKSRDEMSEKTAAMTESNYGDEGGEDEGSEVSEHGPDTSFYNEEVLKAMTTRTLVYPKLILTISLECTRGMQCFLKASKLVRGEWYPVGKTETRSGDIGILCNFTTKLEVKYHVGIDDTQQVKFEVIDGDYMSIASGYLFAEVITSMSDLVSTPKSKFPIYRDLDIVCYLNVDTQLGVESNSLNLKRDRDKGLEMSFFRNRPPTDAQLRKNLDEVLETFGTYVFSISSTDLLNENVIDKEQINPDACSFTLRIGINMFDSDKEPLDKPVVSTETKLMYCPWESMPIEASKSRVVDIKEIKIAHEDLVMDRHLYKIKPNPNYGKDDGKGASDTKKFKKEIMPGPKNAKMVFQVMIKGVGADPSPFDPEMLLTYGELSLEDLIKKADEFRMMEREEEKHVPKSKDPKKKDEVPPPPKALPVFKVPSKDADRFFIPLVPYKRTHTSLAKRKIQIEKQKEEEKRLKAEEKEGSKKVQHHHHDDNDSIDSFEEELQGMELSPDDVADKAESDARKQEIEDAKHHHSHAQVKGDEFKCGKLIVTVFRQDTIVKATSGDDVYEEKLAKKLKKAQKAWLQKNLKTFQQACDAQTEVTMRSTKDVEVILDGWNLKPSLLFDMHGSCAQHLHYLKNPENNPGGHGHKAPPKYPANLTFQGSEVLDAALGCYEVISFFTKTGEVRCFAGGGVGPPTPNHPSFGLSRTAAFPLAQELILASLDPSELIVSAGCICAAVEDEEKAKKIDKVIQKIDPERHLITSLDFQEVTRIDKEEKFIQGGWEIDEKTKERKFREDDIEKVHLKHFEKHEVASWGGEEYVKVTTFTGAQDIRIGLHEAAALYMPSFHNGPKGEEKAAGPKGASSKSSKKAPETDKDGKPVAQLSDRAAKALKKTIKAQIIMANIGTLLTVEDTYEKYWKIIHRDIHNRIPNVDLDSLELLLSEQSSDQKDARMVVWILGQSPTTGLSVEKENNFYKKLCSILQRHMELPEREGTALLLILAAETRLDLEETAETSLAITAEPFKKIIACFDKAGALAQKTIERRDADPESSMPARRRRRREKHSIGYAPTNNMIMLQWLTWSEILAQAFMKENQEKREMEDGGGPPVEEDVSETSSVKSKGAAKKPEEKGEEGEPELPVIENCIEMLSRYMPEAAADSICENIKDLEDDVVPDDDEDNEEVVEVKQGFFVGFLNRLRRGPPKETEIKFEKGKNTVGKKEEGSQAGEEAKVEEENFNRIPNFQTHMEMQMRFKEERKTLFMLFLRKTVSEFLQSLAINADRAPKKLAVVEKGCADPSNCCLS